MLDETRTYVRGKVIFAEGDTTEGYIEVDGQQIRFLARQSLENISMVGEKLLV